MRKEHDKPQNRSFVRRLRPVLLSGAAIALLIQPVGAANESLDDPGIRSAIESEMRIQRGVPHNDLDVRVLDGVVTLEGTVDNLVAEQRALRLAEAVRGVRSVIDRVAVAPVVRPDSALTRDVEAALLADPATDAYEIAVSANSGEVTLSGQVDSWQERSLAETVAQQVRGVRAVHNNLSLAADAQRADAEIRADIDSRLAWNMMVDASLIDVAVDDGVVTLSGTVGSAAEKRRARVDAWLSGVAAVDDSRLVVADWAKSNRLRDSEYVVKPDAEIADAISDALLFDPRVAAFAPTVEVERGVVTLSGVVDSFTAKRAAEQVSRNTVGVWQVRNHLKIRPAERVSDEALVHRVESALARDPEVEDLAIEVSARSGEISLDGTVDSYYDKYRASTVASRLAGVTWVDNNLQVEDDTLVYYNAWNGINTFDLGPANIVEYDWDYSRLRPADWEIRADIRNQLFWSPFVDSDEVTVTVDDGIATLTGTVDNRSERQAARENAYEGGALAVIDELEVDHGPDWLM